MSDVYVHPCCNCPETDELSIQCDKCAEWWHKKCLASPKYGWSNNKIDNAIIRAFICPVCNEIIDSGSCSPTSEVFQTTPQRLQVPTKWSNEVRNILDPPILIKKEKDPLLSNAIKKEETTESSNTGVFSEDDSISSEDFSSESFEEYDPRSDHDTEYESGLEEHNSTTQELKQEVAGLRDDIRQRRQPQKRKRNAKRKRSTRKATTHKPKDGKKAKTVTKPPKILIRPELIVPKFPQPFKMPELLESKKKTKLLNAQTPKDGNFEEGLWCLTNLTSSPLQLLEVMKGKSNHWVAQNNGGTFIIKPDEEVTLLTERQTIVKVLEKMMPKAETSHLNFEICMFLVCLLMEINEEKGLHTINDMITPYLHLENRQTLWCILHDAYSTRLRIEPGFECSDMSQCMPAPHIPPEKRKFNTVNSSGNLWLLSKPSVSKKRKLNEDRERSGVIKSPKKWKLKLKPKPVLPKHSEVAVESPRKRGSGEMQQKRGKMTSKYCGVSWRAREKKWLVQIAHKGKTKNIGVFTDEIEAAKAWDKHAMDLRGKDTPVNFPRKGQRKIFKKSVPKSKVKSARKPQVKKEKVPQRFELPLLAIAETSEIAVKPEEWSFQTNDSVPKDNMMNDSYVSSEGEEFLDDHFTNVVRQMESSASRTASTIAAL